MQDQHIYTLIARQLSGEASEAERQELNAHLQQHAGDQYLYELLAGYWEQQPGLAAPGQSTEEQRFQHLLKAVENPASAVDLQTTAAGTSNPGQVSFQTNLPVTNDPEIAPAEIRSPLKDLPGTIVAATNAIGSSPIINHGTSASGTDHFQSTIAVASSETAGAAAAIKNLSWLARYKWWAAAAAVLLLASATLYWLNDQPAPEDLVRTKKSTPNEVAASPGSRSRLVLPDGTKVWLNAQSRLTYLPDFNQAHREVQLEGEAFFEVAPDARKPFIVHTSGIDIKVLGTAFNVRAYAADPTIEATLLRGSIEVVRKNDVNAPRVILRPQEKLVFHKEPATERGGLKGRDLLPASATQQPAAGIAVVSLPGNQPDSIRKETSWIYNRLVFDGDSFEELAAKMERWYNVHIQIHSEQLKRQRLKGAFEKENITEALDALQFTAPFDYKINGNEIGIFSR
ncbi:MAG: DUF4974 domain-containing protein [Candidatus Pseudobacter hemicellulosilyticus]|uniref:DUF4974 domain-containing protein n=1 Tax=Candidatus Pseudobacter hemicellulosilyticus TaxID=3121375 RepID=A0AAJ5WZA4_9BACT|nr:MAG: DUF4974 domain-containing protein [Pseudobacter sp.]